MLVNLTERHLRVLVRVAREALAGDLLRASEVGDACDVLELLDSKLPAAEERHRVGAVTGRLLFREEILRLLVAAEDAGQGTLTPWEVDDRLTDKPEGTSIRRVVEDLAREKLIAVRSSDPRLVSLTREGRARGRRPRDLDREEHALDEPEQLLDLVYRARVGGLTRWGEDGREVYVAAIWHEPTVQGSARVDAERFAALVAALGADRLIGPGSGRYRTITEDGTDLAAKRFAEHRLPTGPYQPPRLLPPTRRPHELRCRREDCACPLCGRPASWLRTRKGKRYDELRAIGMAEHVCTNCAVKWTIYTEPVDGRGRYDPFGDPAVCRRAGPTARATGTAISSLRPTTGRPDELPSHARGARIRGGRKVSGPCTFPWSYLSRHHAGLARGPPPPDGLGNEKDRVAARSLIT